MAARSAHQAALQRILSAPHPPRPGTGTGQLPWCDPAFSERMLAVHLDPETHMASRAPEIISRHVDWLHDRLRAANLPASSRVLDIGCGPGLYCHELARRGHRAVGFDYAPAPLAWARQRAAAEDLDCTFLDADLTDLPADFRDLVGECDAITFWFGEFHSFPPRVAATFLTRLAACLAPGGIFALEYQPWDSFVTEDSSEWTAADQSVLCAVPHLWLQEYAWHETEQVEVHVHWIIERDSGTLHRYEQCHRAWPDEDLVAVLAGAGLTEAAFEPPITGVAAEFEFPMLMTRKAK